MVLSLRKQTKQPKRWNCKRHGSGGGGGHNGQQRTNNRQRNERTNERTNVLVHPFTTPRTIFHFPYVLLESECSEIRELPVHSLCTQNNNGKYPSAQYLNMDLRWTNEFAGAVRSIVRSFVRSSSCWQRRRSIVAVVVVDGDVFQTSLGERSPVFWWLAAAAAAPVVEE